jgi:hypothetical protein
MLFIKNGSPALSPRLMPMPALFLLVLSLNSNPSPEKSGLENPVLKVALIDGKSSDQIYFSE